jgi:hypothetical protein
MDVRELMKLEVDPAEVEAVYELWKQHSIAEHNRGAAWDADRRLRLLDRRRRRALGRARGSDSLLYGPAGGVP